MNDAFQDDLKAYLDGELSLSRRLTVRLHLTRCESCREEITHMTQIAEDLRASEPPEALDPALRAKILGNAPPAPTTVDSRGGAGEESASAIPVPPELGARGRKRPALGWAVAGAALAAWFVCYPLYQYNFINSSQKNRYIAHVLPASAPTETRFKVFKRPPPKPVPFTVRISDREAGTDSGKVYVQIKDPDSKFQAASGGVQTFDANGSPVVSYGSVGEPVRQVHKEASVGLQVPNPETTSDAVENMVKETGGYVASNNLSTGDDGLKSAELVVKVPVAQFETFLGQVAKLGDVQSKNITGEDITEQTSDADQTEGVLEDDTQQSEARLKALGAKAKWHDEQATRDLRIQLAESRARLVLLKRMAALGTITIDLSQTPKPPAPAPVTGGFPNGLKASAHDALQSLVSSASALAALGIWLLAYAPLWVPSLLIGRFALREYRKRQAV